MNKKTCPHCGEKLSIWRKWQLTDNKYGRGCPHCGKTITLPKWYVSFTYFFNLAAAIFLVVITYNLTDTRVVMLALGAVVLIIINLLVIQLISVKKKEE